MTSEQLSLLDTPTIELNPIPWDDEHGEESCRVHTWQYKWEDGKVIKRCYGCQLQEELSDRKMIASLQEKIDRSLHRTLDLLTKQKRGSKLWEANEKKLNEYHDQYRWLTWKAEYLDHLEEPEIYPEPDPPEDQPWDLNPNLPYYDLACELLDPKLEDDEPPFICNHFYRKEWRQDRPVKVCLGCGETGDWYSGELSAWLDKEQQYLSDLGNTHPESYPAGKTQYKKDLAQQRRRCENLSAVYSDSAIAQSTPQDEEELGGSQDAIAPEQPPNQTCALRLAQI